MFICPTKPTTKANTTQNGRATIGRSRCRERMVSRSRRTTPICLYDIIILVPKIGAKPMRRFLLVLTFFSFAGWSQPAQQQAQLPLQTTNSAQPPVNPPNPWTQFGSLAPGIIAALSALVAIWLTQRHQLRLEIAKAEIAAKYKSHANRD